MTSKINDIPVRLERVGRKITHRLSKNKIPGSNKNPIDSLGYDGLKLTVEGYALNLTDYDQLTKEVFSGPVKLYIKDGWYYNAILEDYGAPTNDEEINYHPFSWVFACEEPFMYSDTRDSKIFNITSADFNFGGTTLITDGNVYSEPDYKIETSEDEGVFLSQTNKL